MERKKPSPEIIKLRVNKHREKLKNGAEIAINEPTQKQLNKILLEMKGLLKFDISTLPESLLLNDQFNNLCTEKNYMLLVGYYIGKTNGKK